MTATGAYLPDGRLHLHHGPIDLLINAEGPGRQAAMDSAMSRFRTILDELVSELPLLRQPLSNWPMGDVARRMARAVAPFASTFVTPMAAVAGAVADEILSEMWVHDLTKAHVNNGGDAAFDLKGSAELTVLSASGALHVRAGDAVRGVATSGWRGRSHSLGIADSVTVLAGSASSADVAATLIANAVDLPEHSAIRRKPARDMSPDSDLGDRLVTVAVGSLSCGEVDQALSSGLRLAQDCVARNLIQSACLSLNDQHRVAGSKSFLTSHPDLAHA